LQDGKRRGAAAAKGFKTPAYTLLAFLLPVAGMGFAYSATPREATSTPEPRAQRPAPHSRA